MAHKSELLLLKVAITNNLMTRDEAQAAVDRKSELAEDGDDVRIENILLDKGFLTEKQIKLIHNVLPQLLNREPSVAPPSADDTSIEDDTAPSQGQVNPKEPIPGYGIKGKLGVGGMATVFLAEKRDTGDEIALKVLHPQQAQNSQSVERFVRESRLLCEFEHDNLVKGYDYGDANGLYYLAMEYVQGKSIQDMLDDEGTLQEDVALDYILQITEALIYIQNQQIVHRDIKPDNVLITEDELVKVCDLGFAQPIGGDDDGEEATTSGTPQYMSPEQARGKRDIDIRSDIYSLGATLYHMVMGKVPFSGGDNMEVMAKQVLEELSSGEVKNRRISHHMHYFIERMMAKDKDLRYQSAQEILDDITSHIAGFQELEFQPGTGGKKKGKSSPPKKAGSTSRLKTASDKPPKKSSRRVRTYRRKR